MKKSYYQLLLPSVDGISRLTDSGTNSTRLSCFSGIRRQFPSLVSAIALLSVTVLGRMMAQYTPRWAYLTLQNPDVFTRVATQIHDLIPDATYVQEGTPHITLHSGFNIPPESCGVVEECLSEYSFEGRTVSVTGLSVWPTPQNPVVVLADVDLDIELVQESIRDCVQQVGGEEGSEPAPAHITLLKRDADTGVSSWRPDPVHVTGAVREAVAEHESEIESTVQIDQLVVDHVGRPIHP